MIIFGITAFSNKDKFCNTIALLALINTSINSKGLVTVDKRDSANKQIKTNAARKIWPKPVGQTLVLCKQKVVFKRSCKHFRDVVYKNL